MSNQNTYTLSKIAQWQLDAENSKIKLPALQRGFVWKPNQIETLWDSVLRGFPIGAFLLSKSGDDYFLLDGQQRATSIALGFYNPWSEQNKKFWSLKKVPVLWIDLNPQKEIMSTQKFSIRLITQSHPWGYQAKNNSQKLSVGDRRSALSNLKNNEANLKQLAYTEFSLSDCYPYDCHLPVPLAFCLKAIESGKDYWKQNLIDLCQTYLSSIHFQTKYNDFEGENYIDKLKQFLFSDSYNTLYEGITKANELTIPGITVDKEILNEDNEQDNKAEDPTLFVRLNAAGTRIAGEELIYSIYKAAFPEAKDLVENIGIGFLAPSLVVSLSARLIASEINTNDYPYPIPVNDFRNRIKNESFRSALTKSIVGNDHSSSKALFGKAIQVLQAEDEVSIPPVLVKSMINSSSELFLMLLQWLKLNQEAELDAKQILRTYSAILWFGMDNKKLVIQAWPLLVRSDFWNGKALSDLLYNNNDFKIYPFIKPQLLSDHLIEVVIKNQKNWDSLYPVDGSEIKEFYSYLFSASTNEESNMESKFKEIWYHFMNQIFWNRQLLMFAQRNYIEESFKDFNQFENLQDTNVPWDFDHIYPYSWVYRQGNIDPNVRHWASSNGNFRLLALEDNRSENNHIGPGDRLTDKNDRSKAEEIRRKSFVSNNDWQCWELVKKEIKKDNKEEVKYLLSAIIHRFCNIYKEWYDTLKIEGLFIKS